MGIRSIPPGQPMLASEVSGIMKATTNHAQVERLDDGEWLNNLLADVHRELDRQPSPQAIRRIRSRLLTTMGQPVKAAA